MADITFNLNQNGTGTIKISIAMTEEALVNQMRTAIDSVFASNQDFLRIANREATNTAGTKRILKINLSNPTTLSTDRALAELICEFFKIANQFSLTSNIVQNASSQYIDNIRNYVNYASIRAEFPTVMGYLAHMQASSAAHIHEYGYFFMEHEGHDGVTITNIPSQQFTSAQEIPEFLRNLISSSATSSIRRVYNAGVSGDMEGKLDIDPQTKGSILAISKGTLKSLLNNLDPESDAVIKIPKLKQ